MIKRVVGLTLLAALLTGPAWADGDPVKGEKLFNRCKACHTIGAGEPNRVGPNLHGMFGRKAGTVEGYRYSKPLAEAGFPWTPEKLYEWLENPRTFLPGNKMTFAGIKDSQQRKDLIAYIEQASK